MATFRIIGYGFNSGDCSIFGGSNPTPFPLSVPGGSKICVFPAQYSNKQYGCAGTDYSIDGVAGGTQSKKLEIWITPEGKEEFFWGTFAGGSQCWEEPTEKIYDCINAACIESKTYKTPGIYKSLSDCETACGTGCSGQCISNAEWNKIQSLANQLKNKNCS